MPAAQASSFAVHGRLAGGSLCGIATGNAAKGRADRHAHTGGVALAQHIAGHHFAGHEQVLAGLVAEAHTAVSSTFRPR
jgi:hypothetical protein